jgi:hypothetical protein
MFFAEMVAMSLCTSARSSAGFSSFWMMVLMLLPMKESGRDA